MAHFEKTRRSFLTVLSVLIGLGIAGPAYAITLDEVRDLGLVGERPDGLVAAVSPQVATEVSTLIIEVNTARLESYKQLAAKDGAPIQAVQAIAGEKLLQKARQNGWYIMSASGGWSR